MLAKKKHSDKIKKRYYNQELELKCRKLGTSVLVAMLRFCRRCSPFPLLERLTNCH